MLSQVECEKVSAIHDNWLQKAAMVWSGSLGPWALDKRDARTLCHIDAVCILSSDFLLIRTCLALGSVSKPSCMWHCVSRQGMICSIEWRRHGDPGLHMQILLQRRRMARSQSLKRSGGGVPRLGLMGLDVAEKRWLSRFRNSMHVAGIGNEPGQVRERHVALMASCFPDWDVQWQSSLQSFAKNLSMVKRVPSPRR